MKSKTKENIKRGFKKASQLYFYITVLILIMDYITLRISSGYPNYALLITTIIKIYLLYKNYMTYVILFVISMYLFRSLYKLIVNNNFQLIESFSNDENEMYEKFILIEDYEIDADSVNLSHPTFISELNTLRNSTTDLEKSENLSITLSGLLDWYEKTRTDSQSLDGIEELTDEQEELLGSNVILLDLLEKKGITEIDIQNLNDK